MTRDPSDALTGRLLDGRYRIGPRIARGGMASVFEAVDTRLDRVVAVKVMHPGLGDDDEFAARFVREARAAARLSHPNVVGVYDQGDEDGVVFLAMEYVPGLTLRDVIRKESPMTPGRALDLIEPVLAALAAAHHAGVIHRDVKPENVLIADDGRVKVADFGLAKAVSTDTQHTATGGVLIGTVSYLAPELVVDGRADTRADVYAAGVVLYELLTGRKPHEGESPIQVAYKHVHEDVPPPSDLVPGLPAYVDALVARATARDRSLRPADARVLLHQVHRVRQALAEGIVDDPELVADLAPPVLPSMTEEIPLAADDADWQHDEHTSSFDAGAVLLADQATAQRPVVPRPPPPDPGDRHRSPNRRGPVFLVVALLLVALVGSLTWYFGFARYTTTPGVIGLTEAQAEAKIEKAGLGFKVGKTAYSETVPAGAVISTDPSAGERILEDGTVTATISQGQERYSVPDVKGKTEDQAQAAILDANLEYGQSVLKYHATIPAGTAIGSNPKAGTPLKPGSAVNVFISQGPKPIPVVDWTGKPAAEAKAALEKLGLVVTITEEFSDTVPVGIVISQTPNTGQLFKGNEVKLVVSKGPALVAVPGVIGMGVEAATARLQEAGFQVKVKESRSYIGLRYVLTQDPGSGEQLPKGSTVTIYLV